MGEETCNPTCCIPLQKGIIIMALVNVAIYLAKIMGVLFWMSIALGWMGVKTITGPDGVGLIAGVVIAFSAFLITIYATVIVFDLLLAYGAKNSNKMLCCVWMVASVIFFGLTFIGIIWGFFVSILFVGIGIFLFFYRAYMVYCVCRFIQSIKEQNTGILGGGQKA